VFTGVQQQDFKISQQACCDPGTTTKVCVTDESRDVSDHKFLRIIVKKECKDNTQDISLEGTILQN